VIGLRYATWSRSQLIHPTFPRHVLSIQNLPTLSKKIWMTNSHFEWPHWMRLWFLKLFPALHRQWSSLKKFYSYPNESTAIRCFVILTFVNHCSSGMLEPQTRKPCKNKSFSQNLAVTGLGLITRRTLVLLPLNKALKSAFLVLIYLPCWITPFASKSYGASSIS
jgi:hypothetical protein